MEKIICILKRFINEWKISLAIALGILVLTFTVFFIYGCLEDRGIIQKLRKKLKVSQRTKEVLLLIGYACLLAFCLFSV